MPFTPSEATAWFDDIPADDVASGAESIRHGRASAPRDWPALAVKTGFAADKTEYYDRLHQVAMRFTRETGREYERADDQQLIHTVRAMADCRQTANELVERTAEWAGSYVENDGTGFEYVRSIAERDPADATERRIVELARRAVGLAEEAEALRDHVERTAPAVAPNLAALAGPVLAARLVALAGGLGALAKKPSGTLQVLGAEDALFAHLQGRAPSPKHGVIYTHEAVQGTRPEDRGSAARALAGKLAIAARVDHYAGDRRPALDAELADRIDRIRARGEP